jgi:hypothetical protein
MPERVSFERQAVDRLLVALEGIPDTVVFRGMGPANRLAITGWDLPEARHFQFGDLRVEGPSSTVVVEIESAGGVTNLVKYWPLLAAGRPAKRFVMVHLFRVTSANDYASHHRLWEYLVDRMREDLAGRCQLRWPEDWEARMFRYARIEDIDQVADFVRKALS